MKRSTILLAALLATTACTQSTSSQPAGSLAGVDQSLIDKAVKPGDDFNAYASGAWAAKTEIPADRSSVGVGFDVFKVAEARNRELIEGAAKANAAAGTDQRRIADYYAAYTDTSGIEKRGLAPIKAQIDQIAALKDKGALSAMLGATMRADTDPINASNFQTENLFGLFVTQDLNRPDVTIPYLMQGGLGLPDRDYYVSAKPEMAELRTGYRAYIEKLLTLAGVSDAAARADRIMALEMKIANAHYDIIASQDAHKAQSWKRGDFAKKAPGIDWNAYWGAAGLPNQQDFSVWQPEAITRLAALVASEPMQSWQDWLTFHQINQVTSVLPKAIDDAAFGNTEVTWLIW